MTWPTDEAREALWAVESTHHVHGDTCTCGFRSPVSRQRTEHITAVALAALAPHVAARERAEEERRRPVTTEVGDVTIVEVPGRACYGVVQEDPDWWHGPAARRWVWDLANGHNGYQPTREAAITAAARGITTTTPELDTWSSASRQHYIDTGEYLPADRKGQDQ